MDLGMGEAVVEHMSISSYVRVLIGEMYKCANVPEATKAIIWQPTWDTSALAVVVFIALVA